VGCTGAEATLAVTAALWDYPRLSPGEVFWLAVMATSPRFPPNSMARCKDARQLSVIFFDLSFSPTYNENRDTE